MALRTIREYGDNVLASRCKEVKEITPRIKELVQDMIDTMYEANGVGLAAPQVGILKRVFVIDVSPEGDSPIVFINLRYLRQAESRRDMRDAFHFPENQEL